MKNKYITFYWLMKNILMTTCLLMAIVVVAEPADGAVIAWGQFVATKIAAICGLVVCAIGANRMEFCLDAEVRRQKNRERRGKAKEN